MSLCKLHRIVLEMVRMFVSMRLHSKVTITIPSFAAKTKNARQGVYSMTLISLLAKFPLKALKLNFFHVNSG